MVKRSYIAVLLIIIIAILFITIPSIDETPETMNPIDKPVDLSQEFNATMSRMNQPVHPIKITIKGNKKIPEKTYINPKENIKLYVNYRNKNHIVYKKQTSSKLYIHTYKYSEPVSTKTTIRQLKYATDSEKIQQDQIISEIRTKVSSYDITSSVKIGRNKYEIGSQSRGSIIFIVQDNKVTKIKTPVKTYEITFNADKIKPPKKPKPNTTGDKETTNCKDLEHC